PAIRHRHDHLHRHLRGHNLLRLAPGHARDVHRHRAPGGPRGVHLGSTGRRTLTSDQSMIAPWMIALSWPPKSNVVDGTSWVRNTTTRSSAGLIQKAVEARPPQPYSPGDVGSWARTGSTTT